MAAVWSQQQLQLTFHGADETSPDSEEPGQQLAKQRWWSTDSVGHSQSMALWTALEASRSLSGRVTEDQTALSRRIHSSRTSQFRWNTSHQCHKWTFESNPSVSHSSHQEETSRTIDLSCTTIWHTHTHTHTGFYQVARK